MKQKEIKEVSTTPENKIVSQHIFMFPFKLKNQYSLLELKEKVIKDEWEHKFFDFKYNDSMAADKYSEWVYFHEYARNVLFEDIKNKDNISNYFERNIPDKAYIVFHIKNKRAYTLSVNHISLRLFETNVGILSIEFLNKDKNTSFDDVLMINDYGRRIYPQYIGEINGTNDTKDSFLADKVELYFDGEPIIENFETEEYLSKEFRFASYIRFLLGKELINEVVPIIDDRMFTVCWYGNDEFSKRLSAKSCGEYEFESSSDWYKYIYIDGKEIGVKNDKMKRQLIKNTTYDRWIDRGTLFGLSRYSLVCVTEEKGFGYDIIRKHMENMYYQMAIILLAQRASVLKFSNDVATISNLIRKNKRGFISRYTFNKVKELYSSFIHFENMLHFIEVTPQEQGIEMYNLAYKNMSLEDLINKLKYEIEKLHEFVDLQYSKESNEGISRLQRVSLLFSLLLPFSIAGTIATFLIPETNIQFSSFCVPAKSFSFTIISVFLLIIGLLFYYNKPLKIKDN